jgi:hypothetical protein
VLRLAGPANFVSACGPAAIAFDGTGHIWLGCDNRPQLLEETTSGKFVVIENYYRPHDFGGMAGTPDGTMIVPVGESLSRFVGAKPTPLLELSDVTRPMTLVPSGVAVAPNGTIYTESRYGDGFTLGAGLVEIPAVGKFRFWAFGA